MCYYLFFLNLANTINTTPKTSKQNIISLDLTKRGTSESQSSILLFEYYSLKYVKKINVLKYVKIIHYLF